MRGSLVVCCAALFGCGTPAAPPLLGSDAGADTGGSDGGAFVVPVAPSCPSATSSGSAAVTFQVDPAHSGGQPSDTLTLPLCRRWARTFDGAISYPLVADGLVFVADEHGSAIELWALDEKTGRPAWGPAVAGVGSTSFFAIAYDAGSIFLVNGSGNISAFDAATGALRWAHTLTQNNFVSSPPTATSGTLYVGGAESGGTVFALDEAAAALRWQAPVENGDDSSPAVADGGVFVSYACNQAYRFDVGDGGQVWHHTASCEGGGGATVAVHGGRVFTRDEAEGNLVLDAADGGELGTHGGAQIPAFGAQMGFFLDSSGGLHAIPDGSSIATWSFTGDGKLVTPPVVVGNVVIVGSSAGALYALDAATGQVLSSDQLPGPIDAPQEGVHAYPAMNAADGMLFVPVETALVAY